MGCTIEFPKSLQIEFCAQGNKQKILIDVLLKHSEMDISHLASILDVSEKKLHDICHGDEFMEGESADYLAQLFLLFFGAKFFRNFNLIQSMN